MLVNLNTINIYKAPYTPKYNKGNSVNTYTDTFPLKNDAVSFYGRAKLLSSSMSDAPQCRDCYQMSINAEPARYYLQKVLDKYISPFVKPQNDSSYTSNKPVAEYYTRTKSGNSIREKVISKYTKIASQDADLFCTTAIDSLNEYFPLQNGIQRDFLVKASKKILNSNGVKVPPYESVEFFFQEILKVIKKYNAMKFNSVDSAELSKIYADVIKKLNSQNNHAHVDKLGGYIKPHTVKGIKHYANDIVGARIIMMDSSPNDTAIILNALKRASDDGYIKINSIENNTPDPTKLPKGKNVDDYAYASHHKLQTFANDTNSELEENLSKSGYLALHINIELTSPLLSLYKGVYSGYSAEIQIIGRDVEQLKEVEDLCYKLKDNKNAINEAYKPFKDYFNKYYTDKTKDAFDSYTYALYLAQRALSADADREKQFPSIEELGFAGKVPPELDFNILKKLKDFCDSVVDVNNQKELARVNNTETSAQRNRNIKNSGDIKTIKDLIDSNIK